MLNNCNTMLHQGRYTWHHNSVHFIIMDTLKDVSDQSWSFYCDLAGTKKIASTTIPPDILPIQQRPNLVLINESSKSIIIIELTVPFEQNIHKAQERKLNMWASPVICKNRVMTPSSFVLRLVAEGSLLILMLVHFNLFSP